MGFYKDNFVLFSEPGGNTPVYYTFKNKHSLVFASSLELLKNELSKSLEISEPYLIDYLLGNFTIAKETCFKGYYSVLPGSCVFFDQQGEKFTQYWKPNSFKYHHSNSISSETIEKTIKESIKTRISKYKRAVISLSGGVDSTYVAYCIHEQLKETNTKIASINYFHSEVNSSKEINFAEKVAKDIDSEFIQIDFKDHMPFEFDKKLPFKPNRPEAILLYTKLLRAIGTHLNKDCIYVSGHGGDHLFQCPPSIYSLSDYFLDHIFKNLKSYLYNLSAYYRLPYLNVICRNFAFSIKRKRSFLDLLGGEFLYEGKTPPPWLSFEKESYLHKVNSYFPQWTNHPSKNQHIAAYFNALAMMHIEHSDETVPTIYPLLCQPMVEKALNVPSYKFLKNQYNRYPLRKALYEKYKSPVAWRRSKGDSTGVIQLGFDKNLDSIKEICFSGYLANNGYLNKKYIEGVFNRYAYGETHDLWPLLNLISLEVFLEYWR